MSHLKLLSENLHVARGRVLFGRFLPGTTVPGYWIDFGNCPNFDLSLEIKVLNSKSSFGGVVFDDEQLIVGRSVSMSLVTDDFDTTNITNWFMIENQPDEAVTFELASDVFQTENKGRIFHLGNFPTSSVSVISLSSNIELLHGVDFQYHSDLNVIELSNLRQDTIKVSYAYFNEREKPYSHCIEGELRFVSMNPVGGSDFNIVVHRATLTPSGSIPLTDDPTNITFSKMSFDIKALLKPGKKDLFELKVRRDLALSYQNSLVVNSTGKVLVAGVNF